MKDERARIGVRQKMRLCGWLAFGLIMLLSLGGCQPTQMATIKRLKVAGSTTVEPVIQAAGQAFMSRFPETEVTVRGGGSTIGIKGIAYGALHIGMASRGLKQAELDRWPNLTATPIGRDGVAVVIHRSLYEAGVRQLTLAQVAAIWRGEITNWRALGGPDLPIRAYDKVLTSGTRATFAEVVLGAEAAAAPGTVGALVENGDVLGVISEERGAVSILSIGHQTDNVVGVAIVGQDGQIVEPTSENVAGDRYPISRDLNLITAGLPQDLAAQFIDFLLSAEGQALVEAAGFSPLSP